MNCALWHASPPQAGAIHCALTLYALPHRFTSLYHYDSLRPSRAGTGERILLNILIARSAIQPQPAMIAMRWNSPVGDPGKTPLSSRADTTVAAIKNTT